MFIQPKKFWLAGNASLYSASGTVPFSIAYVGSATNVVAASSFTFTSQNIGTAGATRLVVVAVAYLNTGVTITGMTIGGSAAAQVSGAASTTNVGGDCSDIWVLAVPAGTTATIAVTMSATAGRCAIQVFNVFGTGSSASTGANNSNASAATSLAQTATVPAGGGAIAIVHVHSASASAFSGTNLTPDNGVVFGSAVAEVGHTTAASGATSLGFTWTTAADCSLSVATFNP